MQLTVREVCDLFTLSENELFRLIKRKEIPSYQINHAHYFNRSELLEWALTHSVKVPEKLLRESTVANNSLPTLSDALSLGGIHYGLAGTDKPTVLRNVVDKFPKIDSLEPDLVYNALMAREALGTTAIGNGIAIPHVRNPIVTDINKPLIVLCFLDNPVDFSALDGQPVTTLFTMMSTSVRIHLHLLSRISFLLQNDVLREFIRAKNTEDKVYSAIAEFETSLPPSSSAQA